AGDLTRRVPTRGTGDDFDLLAASLNDMLDKIDSLMRDVREVSADIAHDLRTPLARLRQRVEVANARATTVEEFRELTATVLRDTTEILKTFSAILRLAEIESGAARGRFVEIDLSALLRAIVELYTPYADDEKHQLAGHIENGLLVAGDR